MSLPTTDVVRNKLSWPVLPANSSQVEARVHTWTLRPPDEAVRKLVQRESVIAHALHDVGIAGEAAITQWFRAKLDSARRERRDVYVLFGAFHDSPGHLRAFSRLIGPAGPGSFDLAVMEQFNSASGWSTHGQNTTLPGDQLSLDGYVQGGSSDALQALRALQHDYTAWKYDYESDLAETLALARAGSVRVLGGDMEQSLRQQTGATEEWLLHVRELNCALAMREAMPMRATPWRVALFWGAEHVEPQGIPRFLPLESRVVTVYLYGQRRGGEDSVEETLRKELLLNDPVLLPLDEHEDHAALLLPDSAWEGDVDRVRVMDDFNDPAAGEPQTVNVRSDTAGTFQLDDRVQPVETTGPTVFRPKPGWHTYHFHTTGRTRVGGVELPARGSVVIDLLSTPPVTRIETHQ